VEPEAAPSSTRLTDIAITLLTPLFLAAAQGDLTTARDAARSMLRCYPTRNEAELLTVVQIIAFVMATISTLSAAMTGDLPAPLMLRAMGCAGRLSNAEAQQRRLLEAQQQQSRPKPPPIEVPDNLTMPPTRPPAPLGPDAFTQEERLDLMEAAMHGTVGNDAFGNPIVPLDIQIKWRKQYAEQILPLADQLAAGAGALPPMECEKQRDTANRLRLSANALRQGKPMPQFPNGSIFGKDGLAHLSARHADHWQARHSS
jgi:hypothetical protein